MTRTFAAALLIASPVVAQTNDPFVTPVNASADVIRVDYREFARIPDIDGQAARMMLLVDEPGAGRLFVNDMRGPLYAIAYDGRTVTEYLNIDDPGWSVDVNASGRERGFQSFAFHPQFNRPGTPGFGKLYTWTDVTDTVPAPDFVPGGGENSHDTVLLEWTARTPGAATYDGGAPRQVLRVEQPFSNHNGGQIAFDPFARPGDADHGLLYIGNADGGSGGDPMNLAQNPASAFGKILRIDPLGRNGANGEYGIPAGNPFVSAGPPDALGEIYALGLRNPQRFGWDPANRNMFVADNPSGEIFHVPADDLPAGGQDPIRRVLLNDGGQAKTLLQLIQAKNMEQGKQPAARADLRFGSGPDGQVFVLDKQDGVVRLLVPSGRQRP